MRCDRARKPLPVTGAVVKLVITPACHAGGRGFESRPPRQHRIAYSWFLQKFVATAGSMKTAVERAPFMGGWMTLMVDHPEQPKKAAAKYHLDLAVGQAYVQ